MGLGSEVLSTVAHRSLWRERRLPLNSGRGFLNFLGQIMSKAVSITFIIFFTTNRRPNYCQRYNHQSGSICGVGAQGVALCRLEARMFDDPGARLLEALLKALYRTVVAGAASLLAPTKPVAETCTCPSCPTAEPATCILPEDCPPCPAAQTPLPCSAPEDTAFAPAVELPACGSCPDAALIAAERGGHLIVGLVLGGVIGSLLRRSHHGAVRHSQAVGARRSGRVEVG